VREMNGGATVVALIGRWRCFRLRKEESGVRQARPSGHLGRMLGGPGSSYLADEGQWVREVCDFVAICFSGRNP
jgi:hypothetical protein